MNRMDRIRKIVTPQPCCPDINVRAKNSSRLKPAKADESDL
jgi:hypothetical protein